MGVFMNRLVAACSLALLSIPSFAFAQSCVGTPAAVQILGSGGPAINLFRSSTSYLLWVDSQAKILVDMGGGSFHRFGQVQAKLSDLAMVAVSHLHPDHVSDLPALLWLSHRSRKDPLPIVGPSGNDKFPNFPTFLSRLFDEKNGAFQVLGSTIGSPPGEHGGGVRLDVGVVDVTKVEPSAVFDQQGIRVTAFGIPHGDFPDNVPNLAYRVQTRDRSIVFSSDQNGTNPGFVQFAKGANVLIMHLALPAGGKHPFHAAPEVIGRIAQEAGVGRLIVSHIGPFSLDPAIAGLKNFFTGPLTVGADLQCTQVE